MPSPNKGHQQLAAFLVARNMSVAELHRGLVARFGSVVKYSRVLSWKNGEKIPFPEGRRWLRLSCEIPEDDWLSPEQLEKKRWEQSQQAERQRETA